MAEDPLADWRPRGVDLSTPSPARIYDYLLDGKDNYQVDRDAGDRTLRHTDSKQMALNNRAFLVAAVRAIAQAGIDQFVDIGAGIPTSPSVYEVARETRPDARVVYVDNDPVVLAHDRALLTPAEGGVSVVEGDVRDPAGFLPQVRRFIDFTKPVGLLLVAVLHYVGSEDPERMVAELTAPLAPGSFVAMSVATSDGLSQQLLDEAHGIFGPGTAAGFDPLPGDRIADLFRGFDLLEPGLTDVERWRADGPATSCRVLGGVGRLS